MPPSTTTINCILDNDVFFCAIYKPEPRHALARAFLNRIKPSGWGIAIETYLAAIRLLMNPNVTKTNVRTVTDAFLAIEMELSGPHPGQIIFAAAKPDPAVIGRATGHKQVMDYWLVQLARQENCKLATFDQGTLKNWPAIALAP